MFIFFSLTGRVSYDGAKYLNAVVIKKTNDKWNRRISTGRND